MKKSIEISVKELRIPGVPQELTNVILVSLEYLSTTKRLRFFLQATKFKRISCYYRTVITFLEDNRYIRMTNQYNNYGINSQCRSFVLTEEYYKLKSIISNLPELLFNRIVKEFKGFENTCAKIVEITKKIINSAIKNVKKTVKKVFTFDYINLKRKFNKTQNSAYLFAIAHNIPYNIAVNQIEFDNIKSAYEYKICTNYKMAS